MSNKSMIFIQTVMFIAQLFCAGLTISVIADGGILPGIVMLILNAFGFFCVYEANKIRKEIVKLDEELNK